MTTTKTQKAYWERAAQLIERCSRELGIIPTDSPSPHDIALWLIEIKPTLSKSTFRQYKAALCFSLPAYYGEEGEIAANRLLSEPQTGASKKGTSKSAHKAKRLPPEDLLKILTWLEEHRSIYARPLQFYLLASVLTGLRPVEWEQAIRCYWQSPHGDRVPSLHVQNAKVGDDRANGDTRTMIFSNFDSFSLSCIEDFYVWKRHKLLREKANWRSLQRGLAVLLDKANKAIWPRRTKHYTLYSARHQAAANWKKIYPKPIVGALLGHASDKTAGTHYGRAQSGKNTLIPDRPLNCPVPSSDCLEKVRSTRRQPPPNVPPSSNNGSARKNR